MTQISCTVCLQQITSDRIVGGTAYCVCGAALRIAHAGHAKSESQKASVKVVLFTLFLLAGVIHAFNWDTYFFSIIPLKAKQLSGFATIEDLKTIAAICEKRQKKNCVVEALEKVFELDRNEKDGLLRVAQIYGEAKKHQAAVRSYNLYFKSGGKNQEARYGLARSLAETGQFGEAKKQFHYILKHDRSKPQFQVARTYVEMLMKNEDYTTARAVIEEYRRAGSTSALFLEKEWRTINQILRKRRPAGGA